MFLDGWELAMDVNSNNPVSHRCSAAPSHQSQHRRHPSGRVSVKLVQRALRELSNSKGSTAKDISDFLASNGYIRKSSLTCQLAVTLDRGHRDGAFVRTPDGHRYKLRKTSSRKSSQSRSTSKSRSASRPRNLKRSVRSEDLRKLQLRRKKAILKRAINSFDFRRMMEAVTAPSPITLVRVGGATIPALIDTGAVLSMMSPEAYADVSTYCPLISQKEAPILKQINPRAANNSAIPIKGLLVADVTIGDHRVKDAYIVVMKQHRPPPTFIVGMNIIRHLKTVRLSQPQPQQPVMSQLNIFTETGGHKRNRRR